MTQPRFDRPQTIAFNQYHLEQQLSALRSDAPIRAHGRDSVTLVKDAGFSLVLVALERGGRLPEHRAPGAITVLVLGGRIAFTAQGERRELGMHDLITLPVRVPHEVEALEESAILITITAPVTHTDAVGLEAEAEAQRAFVD